MSITSNLYPPICPDTCPAFIRTESCKIYFSLSMYNSAADIKNVQISLINQRTNASALKTSTYPSGIKIDSLCVQCYIIIIFNNKIFVKILYNLFFFDLFILIKINLDSL